MNSRKKGAFYENIVKEYLIDNFYEILVLNYREHVGEIDIIAKDGDSIVFVEVKHINNKKYGELSLKVPKQKKLNIYKTARVFIAKNIKYSEHHFRFDLIVVNSNWDIKHIKNFFLIDEVM